MRATKVESISACASRCAAVKSCNYFSVDQQGMCSGCQDWVRVRVPAPAQEGSEFLPAPKRLHFTAEINARAARVRCAALQPHQLHTYSLPWGAAYDLDPLACRVGKDKSWCIHGVGLIYGPAFAALRESARTVVELGVSYGASLLMWRGFLLVLLTTCYLLLTTYYWLLTTCYSLLTTY